MSRFNDDFEVITFIKENSRGVIYFVKSKLDGKEYAVRKTKPVADSLEEKIKRELSIVADFEHPNICRYKEYWTEPYNDKKLFYIQTKFYKENLRSWFIRHPPPRDLNKKLKILYEIVSGVKYIHSKNSMHRNLKPENIFIIDGSVIVADFGFVKQLADELHSDFANHNSRYKCPEQTKTRLYTEKVDIYALGIIFFEMLSPVKFESGYEERIAIDNVKDNQFTTFGPEMFLEKALIESMLNLHPDNRPSARDILKHGLFDPIKKKRSGEFKMPSNPKMAKHSDGVEDMQM